MEIQGVLAGRVALITGAGSGIGRATAELFAEQGAAVIVADMSSAGEETVAAITAAGGEASFVRADVSVEADIIAARSGSEVRSTGRSTLPSTMPESARRHLRSWTEAARTGTP